MPIIFNMVSEGRLFEEGTLPRGALIECPSCCFDVLIKLKLKKSIIAPVTGVVD